MAKLAINGGKKVFSKGIDIAWPIIDEKDEQAVLKVVRSGSFWRGGDVKSQAKSACGKFERSFAKFQGAGYGLAVQNGTVALEAAFRAAGVKPGDEVVCPDLSFVVSASALLPMGAVPVFADCDRKTFQMDPAAIESAITTRTAAICIVHFGGYPADLDKIVKIASKHKLPLIEDSAHAHGTQWRGKGAGCYGDFGTFSFQQSKGMTCGEGGIILTNSEDLWRKAYCYHNLGRLEHLGFYNFSELSSNLRMTDLQGALANTQLAKFKKVVNKKWSNGKYLAKQINKIDGIEALPEDARITRRGYFYFLYHYHSEAFKGLHRDVFLEAMRAEGVVMASRSYGTPIHKYEVFQNLKQPAKYKSAQYKKVRCPVAEDVIANELCSLLHTLLLSDRKTLDKVAEAIVKIQENVDELLAK